MGKADGRNRSAYRVSRKWLARFTFARFFELSFLLSLKNVTFRYEFHPAPAFSSDRSDPVCGDATGPQLNPESWLPLGMREKWQPSEVVGVFGVRWWKVDGVRRLEIAAAPCIPFRVGVVADWPGGL